MGAHKERLENPSAESQSDYDSSPHKFPNLSLSLRNLNIESHEDLVFDTLFGGIHPVLLLSRSHFQASQLP